MDRRTLSVLDKMLRQAEETMTRLERLVKKTQRFETDHLKRLRRLERAALTCPRCGGVLVCPMCGHDPIKPAAASEPPGTAEGEEGTDAE